MPPKRRGRPPKEKGEKLPAAKKPKQQTSILVIDPSPVDTNVAGPGPSSETPGTSKTTATETIKTASVSLKEDRKTKVLNSNVHKQFVQELQEDANGNKNWFSKCKHCPPGKGEYKDRQASHLKTHLLKNHVEIYQMVYQIWITRSDRH